MHNSKVMLRMVGTS